MFLKYFLLNNKFKRTDKRTKQYFLYHYSVIFPLAKETDTKKLLKQHLLFPGN